MAETSIEWADFTFNPWEGCQKVGPGCDNCYAEARNIRFSAGSNWGPGAPRRRTSAANWAKPIKWNRDAAKAGARPRVFCASLADVFDNAVDPQWRADLFSLIRATPHLDWLMLTKRPGNIAKMLPADWGTGWPNVWLGCTVVNQEEADRDIPKLLAVPAVVRFLSMEPLLGAVDLARINHEKTTMINALTGEGGWPVPHVVGGPAIDWIIVGGESGPNARPIHPDWARSLRDQCAEAGVAFHFKQWGEWKHGSDFSDDAMSVLNDGRVIPPTQAALYAANSINPVSQCRPTMMRRVGKASAGRTLDGVTHDAFPKGGA